MDNPNSTRGHLDTPPMGCDRDAIKLFVGNVPKCYTESQLLPLFESVGHVVDLIIVRDRATHLSKGSAFVWYATRALAEEAIQRLHKRHKLPDGSGRGKQLMAVREANLQGTKSPPEPVLPGSPPLAQPCAASQLQQQASGELLQVRRGWVALVLNTLRLYSTLRV